MQKVEYIIEYQPGHFEEESNTETLSFKRRTDGWRGYIAQGETLGARVYRVTEVATKDDDSEERAVVFSSAQCEQDEAEAKAAREVIGKADSMAWWRDSQTEYMVSSAHDVAETLRRYAADIERDVAAFEAGAVEVMAHADDPRVVEHAQRMASRLVQDTQGHAIQALNSAQLPYMTQRANDYVQGVRQWVDATREAYSQELPQS
jgi:hypothetical protein